MVVEFQNANLAEALGAGALDAFRGAVIGGALGGAAGGVAYWWKNVRGQNLVKDIADEPSFPGGNKGQGQAEFIHPNSNISVTGGNTVKDVSEEALEDLIDNKAAFGVVWDEAATVTASRAVGLTDGEITRIINAATRINKPIHLVGSRASGKATSISDWDYVIEGINSRDWSKIKNSLPGAKSTFDGVSRNIDLSKGGIIPNRPYLTFYPKQ